MHFRAHGDRGDRRQGVDSYFGSDDSKMLHNYYLHNDPASGQLAWISWDHNMVLGSSDCLRGQRESCQTKIDWRRRPSIDAWQRCGPSSSIWHPRNRTSRGPIQSTGEDMA
jgi:hypothetical protein